MRKIFIILIMLVSVSAHADIASVNYVRQFITQYCHNPALKLMDVAPNNIASRNYIMNLIDVINKNDTSYAKIFAEHKMSSVDYLNIAAHNYITDSAFCCPTGYFNVIPEKCASCGLFVPSGTCPDNFKEIPLMNAIRPAMGDMCPTGMEQYYAMLYGCESEETSSISMCVPVPQLDDDSRAWENPQKGKYANRGYGAHGVGCKITSDGPICDNPVLKMECHCSASGILGTDNWEEYGEYCWTRITSVLGPYGVQVIRTSDWMSRWMYEPPESYCSNWCCKSYSGKANLENTDYLFLTFMDGK